MYSAYILRISKKDIDLNRISKLLQIIPTTSDPFWEIEINENNPKYNSAIKYFSEILNNSANKLKSIGINSSDISVWYLYEYEKECNIEFNPDDLKILADNEIALCISCWKSDSIIDYTI